MRQKNNINLTIYKCKIFFGRMNPLVGGMDIYISFGVIILCYFNYIIFKKYVNNLIF